MRGRGAFAWLAVAVAVILLSSLLVVAWTLAVIRDVKNHF